LDEYPEQVLPVNTVLQDDKLPLILVDEEGDDVGDDVGLTTAVDVPYKKEKALRPEVGIIVPPIL